MKNLIQSKSATMVLVSLILSVSLPIRAQEAEGVYGRVTDSQTGDTIAEATITITDGNGRIILIESTNQMGHYETGRWLRPGNYTLTATAAGYLQQQIPATATGRAGTEIAFALTTQGKKRGKGRFPGLLLDVSTIIDLTPVAFGSNSLSSLESFELSNVFFAALDTPIPLSSLTAGWLPGQLDHREAGLYPFVVDPLPLTLEPGDSLRQIIPRPARAGQTILLTYTARSHVDRVTVQMYVQRGAAYDVAIDIQAENISEVLIDLAEDQRANLGGTNDAHSPITPSVHYDPARNITRIGFPITHQAGDRVQIGFSLTEARRVRLKGITTVFEEE